MIARLLLRLLGLFAGLVLVVVAVVVLALAALQSPSVRALAEDAVNRLVPGVTVEGLSAGLPSRLAVDRVVVADADGPWLEVERFRFAWTPADLLRGRAQIDALVVERVAVVRLPAPSDTPEPEDAPPFELPQRVFPVVVDELRVDALELGEPVLGEALTLNIAGSLDAGTGTNARALLDVERTDRDGLEASLDAALDLAASSLTLDVSADERSGLLSALTGEPRIEPLTLGLTGSGPLADWNGDLAVEAGTLADLATQIDLTYPEPLGVAVEGRVTAGPDISASQLAPLVEEPVTFELRAGHAEGATVIDRIAITAAWLNLQGDARLADGALSADLAAAAPDLAALTPLAGMPLAGKLDLTATLDGPLPLPPGTVTLNGRGLTIGAAQIAELSQELDIEGEPDGTVRFALDGDVDALSLGTGSGRLEDDLSLRAAGSLQPGGPFALREFAVQGEMLDLDAAAEGDLGSGALDAQATLAVPRLEVFQALNPAAPSGALSANVAADLEDSFGRGQVTLSLTGTELAQLPVPAGALLGAAPELDVEVELDPLPQVRLERFALAGAGLTVDATGEVALDSQEGRLEANVVVPSLVPVGDELGQALAGEVRLDLEAEGGVERFEASADLDGTGVRVGEVTFAETTVALNATGTPSGVEGDLDARLAHSGEALTLRAEYAASPEQVTLDDLALNAPGARLAGGLTLVPSGPSADGQVQGDADLGRLGTWLGIPLGGTVDLALALDSTTTQGATASFNVRGLEAAGVEVARVELQARGEDLTGAMRLNGDLTASGVVQGATEVEAARLSVSGDLAALGIDLTANGTLPDPFRVESRANVSSDAQSTRATLERLTGEVADVPMRLTAPATVRLESDTIELDGLELEIDTARLRAQGTKTQNAVDGSLELTALQLSTLEPFGAPPLNGTVESRWTLSGTPAAPQIVGGLSVEGLEPYEETDEADATVAINADVRLGGGDLNATVALDGLGSPPLQAEARLPIQFSLEPFAFTVADPLPLDARVAGNIDLARAGNWYGLDGQEVSGTINVNLSAGGTTAQPVLDGQLQTSNARLVDVTAGVLVEGIELDVRGTADRIELARLAAGDGRGGRIEGRGDVSFGGGLDVDLAATMTRFAVLQSEDVFIQMSGDADVTGDTGGIDVRSRLRVDSGDITISPGSGAADFATLDVVTKQELEEEAEGEAPTQEAGLVNLDVVVEIPGRLFVRGLGLASEWEGRVEVTGEATQPEVVGLIEYRRGYINLLQNRFEFRQGEIRFTGDYPPDPFLDIEATVPAGEYTAILSVQGPALDPEVSFSSEPPLPEDEVLSQLIFGQDYDNLNSFQTLKLASAIRELRGGRGLDSTFRSGLGLDTFEIGGEDFDSATLRGGLYVTEDVFLELEQGLQEGNSGARVEVELSPRIKAEARVNEDQTGSVGLRWRWDY